MSRFLSRPTLIRTVIAIVTVGALYGALIAWPRYQANRSDSAVSDRHQLDLAYKELVVLIDFGRSIDGSSSSIYVELTGVRERLGDTLDILKSDGSRSPDNQEKQTALLRNLEDVVSEYDSWMTKAGKAIQYSPKDDLGRIKLDDERRPVIDKRLSETITALKGLVNDQSRPVFTEESATGLRKSLSCFEDSRAMLKSASAKEFASQVNRCDKLHSDARAQLIKEVTSVFNSAAAKESERLAKELSAHQD